MISVISCKCIRFALFVAVIAIGVTRPAAVDAVQTGDLVPGPFPAYMATGPRAGMFHAPICEYDLNPSVLVFLRDGAEFDKGVVDLLKALDTLIPKYPQAKLGASLIVLGDGGYRKALESPLEDKKVSELTLTSSTLAKEGKEARLKDLAKKENLQNVTLGFASANDLNKYALDPAADVNVLVLHHQKVAAKNAFAKGTLDENAAKKLVEQVESKAIEVTKAAARRKWTE